MRSHMIMCTVTMHLRRLLYIMIVLLRSLMQFFMDITPQFLRTDRFESWSFGNFSIVCWNWFELNKLISLNFVVLDWFGKDIYNGD